MAEPFSFSLSVSEASTDSDQDFDPTAEMLVDDFDDEHTLEEEEAIESAESVTNELDDLQREGEMPLNEVLAMYGYESSGEYDDNNHGSHYHDSDSSLLDSAQELSENPESPHSVGNQMIPSQTSDSSTTDERKVDDIMGFVFTDAPDVPMGSSRPLLRSVHQASESSDTGTDYDYSPDDDWRKTIQVGSDFQAVIPEGLSKYDDAPAYENEDRLLWDPTVLPDQEVEDYLRQCRLPKPGSGVNTLPTGKHVKDDEQALFLLLQCGHNKDEALRRRRMQSLPPADTMSLWSEDECRSFETGLKSYGKDFHLIQINKVRTRAVGELVQFYYLWKKTERHDVFASKNRIEKKKYALHPGTTDYMDRFLEEQENPTCMRDRSSSPNSSLPIFEEHKKRTPLNSPDTNADSSTPEFSIQSFDIMDGPSSTSTFSTGTVSTSFEREHISNRNQTNNCNEYCGEYMNGEDRVTSTTPTSPNENLICLNMDALTDVSENMATQSDSSKNMPINPPNDVVSCSHILSDVPRFHEGCNFRFDYNKDSVPIE
ncbi:mesoderm induction early response protein 1-like [Uloborus diversus]|uniref:mesoderm induction early response protein 1-like n=1 Tax=Uloborus diversus TaxID=327109 RepID=UPI00240A0CF6|nr:mesoderm induction early response protein 1-like [Uloborus diversus]